MRFLNGEPTQSGSGFAGCSCKPPPERECFWGNSTLRLVITPWTSPFQWHLGAPTTKGPLLPGWVIIIHSYLVGGALFQDDSLYIPLQCVSKTWHFLSGVSFVVSFSHDTKHRVTSQSHPSLRPVISHILVVTVLWVNSCPFLHFGWVSPENQLRQRTPVCPGHIGPVDLHPLETIDTRSGWPAVARNLRVWFHCAFALFTNSFRFLEVWGQKAPIWILFLSDICSSLTPLMRWA